MNLEFKHIICFLVLCASPLYAQVKIGENLQVIDPASLLELESTQRTLVLTRVSTVQMNAITPLNGAVVYNTDVNCIFVYTGQVWRSLCDPGTITNPTANNGLSINTTNTVKLGGTLIQPTTIETDNTNTLSIHGLETIMDPTAMVVLLDASDELKKTPLNSLAQRTETVTIAFNGQNQFATPQTITDIHKIDVYRNGIKINFTAIGTNMIQLESNVVCFDNDEIKIVQLL